MIGSGVEADAQAEVPDNRLPGRSAVRALVALAGLLVLASTAAFLWHERQQAIESATSLTVGRAARLADDLQATLGMAQAAISRVDGRLAGAVGGGSTSEIWQAATADVGALLAEMPVSMRLHPLGTRGERLDLVPGPADAATGPLPLPEGGGWQVGSPLQFSGRRILPVTRAAVFNRRDVAAHLVAIDHQALVRHMETSRVPDGGSVLLFRVDPDGGTVLLARSPLIEADLGQRVRGPLASALAAAPSGVFRARTPLDQTERLVAYQRLGGDAAALVVGYGMATDVLLAPWWTVLRWGSAAALLLLAVIVVGGRRLERALLDQAVQRRELQRSEAQFRTLAENLPDVVVRMDRQGRHWYANAAVQQATGIPPHAFIGRTNADLGMPAENVATWMAALGRAFERGTAERLEFAFPGPQGVRHWESMVTPEPPLPGTGPTALVISRDISERRQAEQARAALHRRLADVLDSMSDGFVSLDRGWHYVAVNRKAGELLGRDAASLLGKHIWTEFPEGLGQPFHRAYERAMDAGVGVVMEEHYAPWDRWFENRIHPSADGISIFFTDVTDRRRALDALKDSERRLREAQQVAGIGNWELDLRSGVLSWSDEVFRIFETDVVSFGASYEAFLAAVHPDDRDAVERAFRRSVDEQGDYAITHRLRFAGGRVKHVHEQGRTIYADGGIALRSVGTVQDITSRVLAEQALRSSEASHREMFESNPHPMWVYDLATLAFLAVNDAAVRKYGYARDEFLRMTIKDIRPPQDVPRLLANVAAVQPGFDDAGTWRHQAKDGRVLEVEITSHTLQFEGREAELVLAHDVTRRNQAERIVRDSEERLRLALQAADQGLYDLDLRSGDAVVSPEYARMLGWEPDEFHETNAFWRERLHPDDRDPVSRVYEDYVSGRRDDYRVEFRQRMRDGGWKWILSVGRIQERDAEGRPLRMLGTHTDITPIKKVQAALQDSEARFRVLFDASPVPTLAYERGSLRLMAVNEAFSRLYGYSRNEALALHVPDLYPAERREAIVDLAARVSGLNHVVDIQHLTKDGRRIDVETRSHDYEVEGRAGRISVIVDVTEQRRAEAALRRSEQRFRLAAASGQVWEWDFDAGSVEPPMEFFESLGYEPARLGPIVPAFEATLLPEDLHTLKLALIRHLKGREPYHVQFRAADAAGRVRWFESQGQALWDEQGRARYMAGTTFEITERREAEQQVRRLAAELEQRVVERTEQLARSEARYRAIFETVPVAIGEEDWSGVQQLLRGLRDQGVTDAAAHFAIHPDFVRQCLRAVQVRRLNRQAIALHDAHHKPAGVTGLESFYPRPEDLPQFVGELEALWAGQRQFIAKRSLPSLAGRPLNLMLTMSLPELDDADGTALVCLVDITEIDRLNAELDRSVMRLRQVNRELETFTYSVSHDLKAPLRGIDGYSRLLLSDHREQLDDEGREFLGHIRAATQHMGLLIDDLLAYSRLERRDLTLARQSLALAVDTVLSALRPELADAGVELELQLDPALHARADAQGLQIALRNLLDNALKFSRTSAPPRIRIEATRSEDGICLSVTDNGIGFDMKFHDRIFSIFQRLHRAEEYPGTGIGLAIVRKAVERMGGRVWARSQPGRGATFTLLLPEADPP